MLDTQSLLTRSISGSIYVALIVISLLLPIAQPLFVLYAFFAVAGVIEFNLLTRVNRIRIFRTTLDCFAAVWLLFAMWKYAAGVFGMSIFVPYFAYLIYVFGRSIFDESPHLLRDAGNSLLSQIIVVLPLALGIKLSFARSGVFDGRLLLFVYVLIWINDTGAYLVGSTLGRHKLLPKVSPKKSVEGLLGGMLLSLVASLVVCYLMHRELDGVGYLLAGLFGVLVSVSATIGDLLESVLKRNAGVKDSGRLIPGHGGVLDRIDSLLFVLPVVTLVALVFELH